MAIGRFALYLPGWTETELVSSSVYRHQGMASPAIHPREGTINDFKKFLVSVPDMVRYYNLISGAIYGIQMYRQKMQHMQ